MKKNLILIIGFLMLFITGCSSMDKAQTGAVVGSLGGAVVGSMTGHGEVLPTLIGAGIGGVGGYIVGNEMDKYDRKQVTQTLETTPSGETTKWTNPDTGKTFQATPQPAKTEVVDGDKKITRDIKLESYVNGEKKLVTAKAYRNDDGQWVLN